MHLKGTGLAPVSEPEQGGGMGFRGLTQVPPVHSRSCWLSPGVQESREVPLARGLDGEWHSLPSHLR